MLGCIFPLVGAHLCTGRICGGWGDPPKPTCGWGDSPIAKGVDGKERVRLGVYAPVAYSHFG